VDTLQQVRGRTDLAPLAPRLGDCLALLSSPRPAEVWEAMRKAPHDLKRSRGWVNRDTGEPTETHPTAASAASRLLGMDARTATGVVATAQSNLVLFEDPAICARTAASDFRGEDLLAGKDPMAVYLTVAPSDLDRMRPLLRIILAQLTRKTRPAGRQVLLMLEVKARRSRRRELTRTTARTARCWRRGTPDEDRRLADGEALSGARARRADAGDAGPSH
jgi:Type IV secretory system Conjugative DNA transfer